ncbi:Hypothetical predicted protein [Olea europaea subsp. europaea]|uniref:Uncharacterized protein n=1 Tax=Olea europaea subsp. europaea TaxID=158383 RepID=A0A8S0TFQ0_OLEEU|nr:Hypothetical predicted protein [Olea europaea subsp. europaea]
MEDVPTFKFRGLAWLFLGVANSDSLLYDDKLSKYFRTTRIISDMIVHLVKNRGAKVEAGWMMPGIQDTLQRIAEEKGESWDEKLTTEKEWTVAHSSILILLKL